MKEKELKKNKQDKEHVKKLLQLNKELKLKHYINGTVIRYTFDGTMPDSIKSPAYKDGMIIDTNITLKAIAFKPGWFRSEVLQHHFYKKKFTPDSVQLITKPDEKYAAAKGRTLNDNDRSDINFTSGKWLGYDKRQLEAVLYFAKPVTASNITLSVLEDINTLIFLPQKVEVYGGDTKNNMRLLGTMTPEQPKDVRTRMNHPVICKFEPATIRCLKLVVKPVPVIPKWHQQKGQKAWVFVDEVFVN